ncbi:uncharacterized protein Dyak_GE27797 [Drosophila yakuba]|uniref:Uncharacterized protein n=1 Tax=Drosophila yakuba TaxID=7245 RepID=A0A0R1DVX7_DROYA|nr:uncharacterized protein Dyak_GE27797 [Drosophila yakuba]
MMIMVVGSLDAILNSRRYSDRMWHIDGAIFDGRVSGNWGSEWDWNWNWNWYCSAPLCSSYCLFLVDARSYTREKL